MQSIDQDSERGIAALEPRSVNIDRAAAMLGGVSRALIYRLIARGELRTVKSSARRLVPIVAIEEDLARLCA